MDCFQREEYPFVNMICLFCFTLGSAPCLNMTLECKRKNTKVYYVSDWQLVVMFVVVVVVVRKRRVSGGTCKG